MINAEQVFDALGDPTRRLVLERIRNGHRSVGDIASGMDVSRPAVSQHLKVLRTAGLVSVTADGTRRLYAPDRRGLGPMRDWLEEFWDEALTAFKAAAERAATKEKKS